MTSSHSEISDKLLSYLRCQLNNPNVQISAPFTPLLGGFHTSIYRFCLRDAPAEYAIPLVLRLYPPGSNSAVIESVVQNALLGQGPPVAKVHFVSTDQSILGGAFFIMDYLPGQQLLTALPGPSPEVLGETQAGLHDVDPSALNRILIDKGISGYRLADRFDWIAEKSKKMPWLIEIVDWLTDNLPAEPSRLSVCHGDIHELNILYDNCQVTGLLDWSGFAIADPVFDIAKTVMTFTFAAKYFPMPDGRTDLIDWDDYVDRFIAVYESQRPLERENLSYYVVLRCVMALIFRVDGLQAWQNPLLIKDLVAHILQVTDVRVNDPG